MEHLTLWVVALPLLSALFAQLSDARLGRRVARISITGTLATFLIATYLLGKMLYGAPPGQIELGNGWGILLFDPLSTLMAWVISGISLVVHLYSVRYMAEERDYARFFVLLDLMTAALLAMVTAGDLITLLVAWHLVGVFLYFLLGHDTASRSAYRYGLWALFTYRLGDLPLVLAAALLYDAFGTWSLPLIFEQLTAGPTVQTVFGWTLTEVVASLVAIAAFARSAQFLLHTWLPYTMAGPTPVSALMHAGIVNAGGFLINRFAPVFVGTESVLPWVFIVGLVTAVIGSVLMLAQNDIKKALGYSTMGQMGFMVMECGIGAFSLAVYHLIAHGLFKGTLFLSAGSIIGAARKDDGVPKDDLYTFVVERRSARNQQPWLLMAALTLAVPATILFLAHWVVSGDFFQKQGAIVLLFFGWVTGAQLIFATYRMPTQNIWRLLGLIIFSFAVVILGYTVISHAFDLFLYPDPTMRAGIYTAANIDLFWFDILVVITTLVVVFGWVSTYYAEQKGSNPRGGLGTAWRGFYTLVAREFFVITIFGRIADMILAFATRLNVWLRWS